jgi:hypothetical protein
MQKSGALACKPNSFNGLHAPNRLGALWRTGRTVYYPIGPDPAYNAAPTAKIYADFRTISGHSRV